MDVVLNMSMATDYAVESEQQQELKIINAAKADSKYFGPLYEKYHDRIFRFVVQRMDDKEIALDVTSQVFLKVLCNLNKYTYREGTPFSSWLYRIAHNEVINFVKENAKYRAVNMKSEAIMDIMEDIETNNQEERFTKLTTLIASLPEDELALIEMRFFEKRPFAEISEILEITENNAKVKVHRILEKLKKLIATS